MQGPRCRDGTRLAGLGLGEQGRGAHLVQQVEAVVAGRAIGAERHVHPGSLQGVHGAEAARELQVRAGAVDHVHAVLGDQGDIARVERGHVHRLQTGGQEPEPLQAQERPLAARRERLINLTGGLVEVHLDGDIESSASADPLCNASSETV